jgi:hypothetical protein
MNAIDRLQLLAELENGFCELNHGPGTDSRDYPASDYLVMPMGYQENPHVEVAAREMVIPVCAGCIDALLGDEWTLFYCFDCCSSQWVHRQLARFNYRHHLLWLRGCPECTTEFGGLYFNDFWESPDELSLLATESGILAA